MSGRLLSLGMASALLIGLAGAIGAACYEVPRPACGFLCGPDGACPDGYACASDHACHRLGTPATLVCSADAGLPVDASANDAAQESQPDTMPDTMADAPPDSAVDAAVDASADAPDAAAI